MSRIVARETAFKLLFEFEFNKQKNELTLEEFLAGENIDDADREWISQIYNGVTEHNLELEDIISSHLKGYVLSRVYKVDLAILKLAVYEIKFVKDTPVSVIINEAVELSKKYSTDNSYKFINGVLASIVKEEQ